MYKCEDEIRPKIKEFSEILKDINIIIEEYMVRDYLIKYKVFQDKIYKGIIQVFYSPNKRVFTLKSEKLNEDTFMIMKNLFNKPISKEITNKTKRREDYRELTLYYEILQQYRTRNFDYTCFSEKLLKYFKDSSIINDITENSDDFNKLEEYYLDLINKN